MGNNKRQLIRLTENDVKNIIFEAVQSILLKEYYSPLGNINPDEVNEIRFTRNVDEEGDEDENGNPIPYITYSLELYDAQGEYLGFTDDLTIEEVEENFGEDIASELQSSEKDKGYLSDILDFNQPEIDINNPDEVDEVAKRFWKIYDYATCPNERGYILRDGTLLFFGENIDHVNIQRIDGMTVGKFVSLGNIRVFRSGFELEKEPTLAQRKALKLLIQNNESDEISFDIVKYGGKGTYAHPLVSRRYITHRPNIVLNQIDNYFYSGIKPKEYFEENKKKDNKTNK